MAPSQDDDSVRQEEDPLSTIVSNNYSQPTFTYSVEDGDGDKSSLNFPRGDTRKASFFIGDQDYKIPVKIIGPDDQEIGVDEIVVAPDGGWGWVIVFAAFMSNVIVDGIIFSFGVMMQPIRDSSNGEIQISTIAWVGSLLTGFYLMSGPFVSSLANRFGFRPVAIVGSILAASAFTLSWLLCRNGTNIGALFAVYGVMGGIGFGCIYVPAVVAVGFYFEKKRALATGIAICGSGIGTFIFAPLVSTLVDNFGWEKSLLFLAAIILLCALMGSLYRPLEPKQEATNNARRRTSSLFPTPEGTPLMMRIKRARDMEKWDSVNSFNVNVSTELLPDGTNISENEARSRAEKLYNRARKSSTQSLNTGIPLHQQQKRMSVPSMQAYADAQQQQLLIMQRTNSTRAKSFVGLPDLKEIAEETEQNSEDSPSGGSRETSLPPTKEVSDETEPTSEKLMLPTDSSVAVVMDGNENTTMQNKNSATTVTMTIGNSTLTVDEMTKSRILRVGSRVTLNKPLYRDDIFYTGSMRRIPDYVKHVDTVMTSVEWSAAVSRVPTGLPTGLGVEDEDPHHMCCSINVLKKMLDFSLLLSPTFVLLAVSGGITMLGFFVPFMYLTGIAMEAGVDKAQATFLISIIGIANTVGRIICGWVADRPSVNALVINNVALTVGGLVTAFTPFLRSNPLLIIYSCTFGLSMACFASLRSILLVELLGLNKLTNAFGLLLLFQGIAAMVGSPLAGFLYDSTGNYDVSFYVAGCLILISGIMCYPLNYVNNWEINREQNIINDSKNVQQKS